MRTLHYAGQETDDAIIVIEYQRYAILIRVFANPCMKTNAGGKVFP